MDHMFFRNTVSEESMFLIFARNLSKLVYVLPCLIKHKQIQLWEEITKKTVKKGLNSKSRSILSSKVKAEKHIHKEKISCYEKEPKRNPEVEVIMVQKTIQSLASYRHNWITNLGDQARNFPTRRDIRTQNLKKKVKQYRDYT